MASFRIIPGQGFDKQLKRGALKSGGEEFIKAVNKRGQQIVSDIAKMLVRIFNETSVARALRGQGTDLPAHFGLTDTQASQLVDGMSSVIASSVRLDLVSGNVFAAIVRAVESDYQKFLALPGASYISPPSKIRIPVMQWMLLDPSIDIGQAAYSIVFDSSQKVSIKNSRSGRAVMKRLGLPGANVPYVLPSIVHKKAGKNFLEFALGQPTVVENIVKIVRKYI